MTITEIRATIERGFSRWINSVADSVAALFNQLASPRAVKLVERGTDEFRLQAPEQSADGSSAGPRIRIVDGQIANAVPEPLATTIRGSRVEIMLNPDRFLFCSFELPGRAADFLDGIVRSQIDRLTPWNASEAAFGWSKPTATGADRITVNVAATERALVVPYVHAVAGLGAQSITVFTAADDHQTADAAIKVFEERASGFLDVAKIRQRLIAVLVLAGAVGAVAICGSRLAEINLDAQQAELDFRLARFRAAAGVANASASASLATAEISLEKRKHSTPPTIITLEILSQILPDDTYVTELHIEDNKIRLEGATHNAPALIGLIEQSGLFARAIFFAPTTRSPSETVERFHIEADIQSMDGARS